MAKSAKKQAYNSGTQKVVGRTRQAMDAKNMQIHNSRKYRA